MSAPSSSPACSISSRTRPWVCWSSTPSPSAVARCSRSSSEFRWRSFSFATVSSGVGVLRSGRRFREQVELASRVCCRRRRALGHARRLPDRVRRKLAPGSPPPWRGSTAPPLRARSRLEWTCRFRPLAIAGARLVEAVLQSVWKWSVLRSRPCPRGVGDAGRIRTVAASNERPARPAGDGRRHRLWRPVWRGRGGSALDGYFFASAFDKGCSWKVWLSGPSGSTTGRCSVTCAAGHATQTTPRS